MYGPAGIQIDDQGFIRLDDWEMRDDIQTEVSKLWSAVNTDNLEAITDIQGYRHEFQKLFGFDLAGVNYAQEVDPVVQIPSIPEEVFRVN